MTDLLAIFLTELLIGIGAFAKLWFSNERLKERVKELEEGHKEILKELKESNNKLTTLTAHVELLLLGKIKTANRL